jgi:hypothetical protein
MIPVRPIPAMVAPPCPRHPYLAAGCGIGLEGETRDSSSAGACVDGNDKELKMQNLKRLLRLAKGGGFAISANRRTLRFLVARRETCANGSLNTNAANGNTISTAGIANTYDFENRMTGHGAITLIYDGDGNRVSETYGRHNHQISCGRSQSH